MCYEGKEIWKITRKKNLNTINRMRASMFVFSYRLIQLRMMMMPRSLIEPENGNRMKRWWNLYNVKKWLRIRYESTNSRFLSEHLPVPSKKCFSSQRTPKKPSSSNHAENLIMLAKRQSVALNWLSSFPSFDWILEESLMKRLIISRTIIFAIECLPRSSTKDMPS